MSRGWVSLAPVMALLCVAAPAGAAALTSDVDTRIGTAEGAADFGTGGGAGATYPGPVAPFGMVQLSPDTFPSTENPAGGYSYEDTQMRGFSLTHISGAGCAGLQDVPLLPTTHAIDASPSAGETFDVDPRYVPTFSHRGEVARPGDYRVALNPGAQQIGVELTAAERAGALRLTFPSGAGGSVLVNAGGSAMGNTAVDVHVDAGRREITGSVSSGGFCYAADRYRVYFVARFDQPFAASGTWRRTTLQPGATDAADAVPDTPGPLNLQYKRTAGLPDSLPGDVTRGALAGAYATFGTGTVTAKVAISSVSVAGARRNLDADGAAPFDAMRTAATRAWERRLSAIRVDGGSAADRKTFSTALYHTQVMPNVFSDADGQYRGMDGAVHRAVGFDKYANVSGWDTYRAQLPLMALVDPKAASDLAASLTADGQQSGALPKWPVLDGQTNVMVGDPADLLIAGAYAFGARSFDTRAALATMVEGATVPKQVENGLYVERAGLEDYLRLGYVGFERNTDSAGQTFAPLKAWGTAATTLEYALADFGIARLAAASGDVDTCRTFAARAGNWRNVWDADRGLVQPRNAADGGFVAQAADSVTGFVEGSAEQYTWYVPQDVAGLVRALGGRNAALKRLDAFFTRLNAGADSRYAFLGNEPTLGTPYLYDWLGAPARGAAVVREAMQTLYQPTPGGFPGNDDGGSMSAWWVFGALGLHPSVPGTGVLTLGSPLFDRARLRLAHGTLDIRTSGQGVSVATARFAGRPLKRTWLTYDQIAHGGTLRVALTSRRSTWGTKPSAAPPSYGGASAVCG